MSGEPPRFHDGTPRSLPGLRRDQVPGEKEQNGSRERCSPASSDVSEDVAAFYPMSLLRELLREELDAFADTRLRSLLTTELGKQLLSTEPDKRGPARAPRIRSSAVDTGQGESVPVDALAELGKLMPNSVPEPSDLRRPPREVPSVNGHRENTAWLSQATPQPGVGDAVIRLAAMKKSRTESGMERLVDDATRRINRLSDYVDRQCSCPLVELLERSTFFNFVAGLLILANSIVMALSAEYEIQHIEGSDNQTYMTAELGFVIAYTVEWLIRACSGRCRFLGSSWCWFDLCILLGGWLEVGGGHSYVTQFRILRVLKMLKVMRVVRLMRSFREVRVLLDSLMGSVRPLVWASLLVAGITFMFAILFVNSVSAYLKDQYDSGYPDIDALERESLLESWGSVLESMYTLFSCVSGGEDWRGPASLLQKVGIDALIYFLVFVIFFCFAITNSVCAFFVESASDYSKKDHSRVLQERLSKKKRYVEMMESIFRERETITKEDFMRMVEDKRLIRFATDLDIDPLDLSNFFDRLSAQGQKAVDVELFVEGCIRLCGQSRSMDVIEILTKNETMLAEMRLLRADMEESGTNSDVQFEQHLFQSVSALRPQASPLSTSDCWAFACPLDKHFVGQDMEASPLRTEDGRAFLYPVDKHFAGQDMEMRRGCPRDAVNGTSQAAR